MREIMYRNITTVIDGAHALGALDLNLALIDADFYVSNSHKWLCNPKVQAGDYSHTNTCFI